MHLPKSEWSARAGTRELEDQCELALRTDGYFLLEEVFDRGRIQTMHDDFARLLEAHIADTSTDNRGRNRYNIPIPARAPFVDTDTVLNPLWFPLLQRVLGEDLVMNYVAADTPLQGSDYQGAHADAYPLYPGQHHSLPACNIVVNVMLTDFTWENGPLEIWPNGSHQFDPSEAISGSRFREPEQVTGPAGSVVVRDARMWHRGSPNRTPHMRPMLALTYQRSWYRFDVGYLPVAVDADTYRSWPHELQKLFRFGRVPGDLNAPVIHDTLYGNSFTAAVTSPESVPA